MAVRVVLGENAKMPERKTEGAAGFDLHAAQDVEIWPKSSCAVSTGVKMAIPSNFFGKVCSRSGLAFNHGVEVGAGIIDSDYRGEIKVLLHNHGQKHFQALKGDRIAQIIFIPYMIPKTISVNSLDSTRRGKDGFGSTSTR